MATLVQAVRMALHVGETRLGVTDVFGEDVGPPLGGVFTATQGLRTTWNSPLDERGIIGMATGLALAGQKPVAEIQFCDYAFNTVDLLKVAGNTYWSSNGDWNVPMVVMTPVGAGIHGSIYHSHSFDAQATRIPGWKIVMPSRPVDAYGLMLSAIEDPNPVMVLLPKALMRVKNAPGELITGEPDDARELSRRIDAPIGDRTDWEPDWPETGLDYVPIGEARVARPGRDLTVVTYGRLVLVATAVAEKLAAEGLEAEVVDLRTLHPYDWRTIDESVRRTRRVLFANEDTEVTNFGEHLLRRSVEELWDVVVARPRLHAGKHVPGVGLNPNLENASVPTPASMEAEMRALAATTDRRVALARAPRAVRPPLPSHLTPELAAEDVDFRDVFGRMYGPH